MSGILQTDGSHVFGYTATGAITSGSLILVGKVPGVVIDSAVTGERTAIAVGVAATLPKRAGSGTAVTVGGYVTYVTTGGVNAIVGSTTTGETVIGYGIAAAATGDTIAKVRLMGGAASDQGESWEDLRAPATAIPVRGQSGDPDVELDGTLLFDSATGEQIAVIWQMPHAWDRDAIRPHVHWSKTTSGTGDVKWEYRYRIANNNAAMATGFSAWVSATGRSMVATGNDAKDYVVIDAFPELSMDGYLGSCIISTQIRRNGAATGDTYGDDARLWEADIHYRVKGLGSETEIPSY
jgi:predicted RecA/RadA family phage recombinase